MMLGALSPVRVSEVVLSFGGAVGIDPLGNRIPVDAQGFSRMRNAFLVSGEGLFNVKLFKLVERFIQKDVAVEHIFDYSF
jgi:hypothetical protein